MIAHNLDVIKTADWLIDLGPEGGVAGGETIGVGTPEEVAGNPHSFTGQFLRPILAHRCATRTPAVAQLHGLVARSGRRWYSLL